MLDLSPKPVLLPVPTEYRHFVIRKWNSDYLVGMLPGVFALIIVALRGFKGIHFEWWHIAVIPALLAAWLFHSRKQWYSGINKNGVRLIYYSRSFWSTRDILWKEEIILSVHKGTWCDFPALILHVAPREETMDRQEVLQLVYCPNDEYKVRDEAIPAIEYYREKYAHDEWIANHGWEIYIKPSELAIDG